MTRLSNNTRTWLWPVIAAVQIALVMPMMITLFSGALGYQSPLPLPLVVLLTLVAWIMVHFNDRLRKMFAPDRLQLTDADDAELAVFETPEVTNLGAWRERAKQQLDDLEQNMPITLGVGQRQVVVTPSSDRAYYERLACVVRKQAENELEMVEQSLEKLGIEVE